MKFFAAFPGQGSQSVGMGKELFENFKIVRELFEEGSEATQCDLKTLCFEGPEKDLQMTSNTQPCLLLSSLAAFRVCEKEFGFRPDGVAGHSLGEYTALVAAGSLRFDDAMRWVRFRGEVMQEAAPAGEGAMSAVLGLSDLQINELCQQATTSAQQQRQKNPAHPPLSIPALVEPANFNAPGQVVISGSADAVALAHDLLQTDARWKGGKAIALAVSAPFHCALMSEARAQMAKRFAAAQPESQPKTPLFPYIPNRTGRPSQDRGLVFQLLIEQMDHPVLWTASMQAMLAQGCTDFVEFGPGKVLQGLLKRIAPSKELTPRLHSMAGVADLKKLELLSSGGLTVAPPDLLGGESQTGSDRRRRPLA